MATWKIFFYSEEQREQGLSADFAVGSDGANNLTKYGLGLMPQDSIARYQPMVVVDNHGVRLTHRINTAADVTAVIETSNDLVNWQPADTALQLLQRVPHDVPIESRTYRYTGIAPSRLFFRVNFVRNNFDTDGDGLADDWEVEKFSSLTAQGQQDDDRDGMDNTQEQQQNSDPLDPYNGNPPPDNFVPPEAASADSPVTWVNFVLPEAYRPLFASESGIIALTSNEGAIFRWQFGNLVPVTADGRENVSFINNAGTLVGSRITGDGYQSEKPGTSYGGDTFGWSVQVVKIWRTDRLTAATIRGPTISFSDYSEWYDVTASGYTSAAIPLGLDDRNNVFYWAGGRIYARDRSGSSSAANIPSGVNPTWITNQGTLIGYITSTGVRKCFIDNRIIDVDPQYVNKNGAILGVRGETPIIRYADGLEEPAPATGEVSWIDDQDRPSGTLNGEKVSWRRTIGTNGQLLYEPLPFEPLILSNGWITDHKVPPGTRVAQLGRAWKEGETRDFVAIPVNACMAVDADRDGQISGDDTIQNDPAAPFRFWLNDDDDDGDTDGGDGAVETNPAMNNGPANWQGDGHYFGVNGVRDLVDFFPVLLDLKQLLTVLPATTPGVKYKLKQADSALNFVYTGLTRANALSYQTEDNGAIYGPQFDKVVRQAETHWITAEGVELSAAFLTRVQQQDQGVILVEGRKVTTQPLILSVEKDGTVIAEVKLELSISSVEDMYRRINLRDGAEAPAGLVGDFSVRNADLGLPSSMGEPANFPDSLTNGKWFVFVVGSNVGGAKMRGWQSEVFKRMYWSQSKARFVGVSWYGDPYSDSNDWVYDYHSAARNAFTTAPVLTAKLNALAGTKTIAGHSAAALIISSAVADHGLSVSSACLIDAAMARECFDGSGADDITGMVPAVWRDYPSAYWASHWHEAFGASDARSSLTWRNRFSGAASVVHNFYSSTEDVLGRYDGTVNASIIENLRAPGSFAWVIQEKAKGDKLRIGWFIHGGSDYGGWGFNRKDPLFEGDGTHWTWDPDRGRMPKTAAELGTISAAVLRRYPVFEPGWGKLGFNERLLDTAPSEYTGPSWIFDLYGAAAGNAIAADPVKRSQILNEAIPALSLAVGSNATLAFEERNYNLPSRYADAARWPSVRGVVSGVPVWHHSDMREVAYFYLARFYDKLSSLANQ